MKLVRTFSSPIPIYKITNFRKITIIEILRIARFFLVVHIKNPTTTTTTPEATVKKKYAFL